MLLGNHFLLENRIVTELAKKPNQTVKELTRNITERSSPVSFQAAYLALSKLENEAVVIKNALRYSVAIHWILAISDLSRSLLEQHLQPGYINHLLPTEDKPKKTWVVTDPKHLNLFWSQLLLAVTHNSKEKVMYDYNQNLWFQLLHKDWEATYWTAQLTQAHRAYILVTHDNYLNRNILEKDFKFPNAHTHILKRYLPGLADESTYVTVFDDLLLTVKLDSKMVENITALFSIKKETVDQASGLVSRILFSKIKAKIVLEKNQKKADLFKKKFSKIFG